MLDNQGAKGTPQRDNVWDRVASVDSTISFTVDVKQYLTRAGGLAVGTRVLGIRVAGGSLNGGESAAAPCLYVHVQ